MREGRRTAGGKLLDVLDAFTRDRRALTLSEIARAADVPLSTAHRLIAELCAWGGLERDDDGRYRIGLRLWELGALAPRALGLREAALPFMEDLYEVTHEDVQLAVRDETEVVFRPGDGAGGARRCPGDQPHPVRVSRVRGRSGRSRSPSW